MRKQEEDTFCSVSLICFCFINWTLTPCLAQALGFWNTLGFDLGYYSCRMKSFIGPLHPICQACLLCVWWGSSLTWAGAKLCFGSACSPLLSPFCQRVRGGGVYPFGLQCKHNWLVHEKRERLEGGSYRRPASSPNRSSAPSAQTDDDGGQEEERDGGM